MVNAFTQLSCGKLDAQGHFNGIGSHLAASIGSVGAELLKLPSESHGRIALFGPFLGRTILELTYTALIGRLDPFRLLALREIQMQIAAGEKTKLGERCPAAIQWTGDVRPDKPTDGQNTWSQTKAMDKVSRSLFGKHYEDIYWIPAFTCVLDSLTEQQQGAWFDELRGISPNNFINRFRTESDRTYSSLSKGIHHEFVIPTTNFYSPETVFELLKDALRLCAGVALVCHAIPTCHSSVPLTEALALYKTIQDSETSLCLPTPKMT